MARFLIVALFLPVCSLHARDLDAQYKKAKFKIGAKTFTAYIADTDDRRTEGLMNVTKLPADTGMLFIFEQEQPVSFWMKNTLIPLSIGFIDKQGTLVDVQEMEPAQSMLQIKIPTYESRRPARYALEMEKGWFSSRKVKTGAKLSPLPARH